MNATALIVFGLIACASAGILSPYVGYSGYYSAPVVSRTYTSAYTSPYVSSYVSPYVSHVSPYVSRSYVSPYVARSYVAAPYVAAAPVAYTSGYSYSPYAAYNYLLKK